MRVKKAEIIPLSMFETVGALPQGELCPSTEPVKYYREDFRNAQRGTP